MNLLKVKKTKRTKKKTRQNVTMLKQLLRSRKVQDFARRNSPEGDERMFFKFSEFITTVRKKDEIVTFKITLFRVGLS